MKNIKLYSWGTKEDSCGCFDIETHEITMIGFKCNFCGHEWGIKLARLENEDEIPKSWLVCDKCGK